MSKEQKLNLSFDFIVDDYTNVNVRALPGVDVVSPFHDLRVFKDESMEEVYSNYVIERLPLTLHAQALKEWWRILKPGGKLFIFCPDGNLITKNYVNNLIDVVKFSQLLFGNDKYAESLHRCAFDLPRLVHLCTFGGFEFVKEAKRPNAYEYELGVECKKPETKYPY